MSQTPKLAGPLVLPHIAKVNGLWRVFARHPWHLEPGSLRLAALRLDQVHFMTVSTKRFHDAKAWAVSKNARIVANGRR